MKFTVKNAKLNNGAPGEQDQKIGCWDQRWGGRAGRIKEGKFRVGGSVGFRPGSPRSSGGGAARDEGEGEGEREGRG